MHANNHPTQSHDGVISASPTRLEKENMTLTEVENHLTALDEGLVAEQRRKAQGRQWRYSQFG
jgi:hypothetical protein